MLDTNVNLSNLAWTGKFNIYILFNKLIISIIIIIIIYSDVCYVKICLSMLIDEMNDFEESMLDLVDKETYQKIAISNTNQNLKQRTFKNQCDSIELSNIVKIYFEPSLAKKFI